MNQKLRYRLITGKDDASFCSRISALLEEGYVLYGSPALTYNGRLRFNCTRIIAEPILEREFFTRLVKLGIPVKVESNQME